MRLNDPSLVAIVSVYKSSKWLRNRIDNLLNSDAYKNNELIIYCVNASSPDVQDDVICQSYSRLKNFQYDVIEFCTVYAAWNHVIQKTNTKYITNANADDIVSPSCYSQLIEELNNSFDIGFIYPSWYRTRCSNLTWDGLLKNKLLIDSIGWPGTYKGKNSLGHFPIWRRSLHNKLGLFDEKFKVLGDADWWIRCYYLSEIKFKWCKEFLACYVWRHGENLWYKEITEHEWQYYNEKVQNYKASSTNIER